MTNLLKIPSTFIFESIGKDLPLSPDVIWSLVEDEIRIRKKKKKKKERFK